MYQVNAGSVAANASAWACVGSDCPTAIGSFDFQRFNVKYWRNYEKNLRAMQAMGVIADIIVFHPYDNGQWGFDCMGCELGAAGDKCRSDGTAYNTTNDNFYLKYLAARVSSFSNVW